MDNSDTVLLVMEILPAQELKKCLMVNKLWRGLAEIVVRKRLLSSTVNKEMPPLCGNERIPADILVHYEEFVGGREPKFGHLEGMWSSRDNLAITNSVTKGKIDSKDRNINHVSIGKAHDNFAIPTLMPNGQIVLCLQKTRPQFCISMFLVDPYENTMKWLPWKPIPDIILPSTSTNARWYVYCTSGGQLVVCDPVSLECARYPIKDRVKWMEIHGDFLVAGSPCIDNPSREVLDVYKIPRETVNDGLKEVLTIFCDELIAYKLNEKFLVVKDNSKQHISIYNLREKNLYHTFSVPGFAMIYDLTRFHCVVYQLNNLEPEQHRMSILNLSTLSLHEVDINMGSDVSDVLGINWCSEGFLYDERGLVLGSASTNGVAVATWKGTTRLATGIPEPNYIGYWMCISGTPLYRQLPLPLSVLFGPRVEAMPKEGNSQTLNITSHHDGCFLATHPLKPGTFKGDPIGYYELEIKGDYSENSVIVIGLARAGYSSHLQPGWEAKSAGYHSDDGKLFVNNGVSGHPISRPFSSGDTVGIAYHYNPEFLVVEYQVSLNGEFLEKTLMDSFYYDDEKSYLYPCIGADGDFDITIKFPSNYPGSFASSPFL